MKRNILKNQLTNYYSLNTISKILQGKRKPRYEVMLKLHQDGIVPFEAWLDIRSWLNDSNTKGNITSLQQDNLETTNGR